MTTDNKGIYEPLRDIKVASHSLIFYLAETKEQF